MGEVARRPQDIEGISRLQYDARRCESEAGFEAEIASDEGLRGEPERASPGQSTHRHGATRGLRKGA